MFLTKPIPKFGLKNKAAFSQNSLTEAINILGFIQANTVHKAIKN